LDDVINNFRDGGKSVNYVCFLYDYLQAASSDAWPRKEEILELLSHCTKFLSSSPPEILENPLAREKKVPQVVERNKTAVKRHLKRISATSFSSIFFIASRKSFDKNIKLFLSGST